jgi:cell division protein FtsZ
MIFDTEKVTVVGVGKAGINVINTLTRLKPAQRLTLTAIDTDRETLDKCEVEKKILADSGWPKGVGCGGDVIKGQRALARERGTIARMVENSSLTIVTGGLGGGMTTGGAPIIASVLAEKKIPAIFMMTLPFSFEGHSRLRIADDGIKELLPAADVLLCLPNDLLFSALPADAPVEEAFAKADVEMARAILGMSELIRCKKMLSADFSSFRSILNNRKSTCCFGIGSASAGDGLTRSHIALERMLKSPFLGGSDQLREAHAVLLVMTGGPDLQIGEMKKTLEAAENLIPASARIITGVNTDASYEDNIQLTAIAVRYDKTDAPEIKPVSHNLFTHKSVNHVRDRKHEPTQNNDLFQDELPLQNISKGIFINSTPFMHKGEDFDIPTFQRKMIKIDKGE